MMKFLKNITALEWAIVMIVFVILGIIIGINVYEGGSGEIPITNENNRFHITYQQSFNTHNLEARAVYIIKEPSAGKQFYVFVYGSNLFVLPMDEGAWE